MTSLQSKTIKGVAALSVGKGAGRVISFANTILLARILSPDDYGLMAMAMVVSGFIAFFNEVGLGSAIIQRKEVTKDQLNGAFSIAVSLSIMLYGISYMISASVGEFYGNQEIGDMLVVLASSFVIGSFSMVSSALISKHLQFKALAGIEFVIIITQAALTLVLALNGYKAWALVYGFVISQLLKAIFVILVAKWRPSKFGCFKAAMELIKFGLTVTYAKLTWYAYGNAATFIIGKFSGEKSLGIYSMANTLAGLPTEHITSLIGQVSAPVFSKLQDDFKALNKMLCGFTAGIALLTFPLLAGLASTATELVPLLLGEQWLAVIFPMQALAVMGLFRSISPLLGHALISTGQVKINAYYTTLCAVVVPTMVLIGVYWRGIEGVALMMPITYGGLISILLLLCKKHIQLSLRQYCQPLITPLTGSLMVSLGVYTVKLFCAPYLTIVPLLLIEIIIGVAIYFIWLVYVRTDGLLQLNNILQKLGVNQNRLKAWPFGRLNNL
jgi:O-antigen/teichoic acid export membrane protein